MEDRIARSNSTEHLNFLQAMLVEVLSNSEKISEEILLGCLQLVVDAGATFLPYSLFSEDAPLQLRLELINSMYECFAKIFAKYCEPCPIHDEGADIPPWSTLCYMWWELLPRHGVPKVAALREIDAAILAVLRKILLLDHIACKRAALHGLALWQISYPDEIRSIISEHSINIPLTLKALALKAATGNTQ